MKPCPACGYEGTPTDRQILRFHKKHFAGFPIREMIHRGWLSPNDPMSLFQVRAELQRFFQLDSDERLTEFLLDPRGKSPIKFITNEPHCACGGKSEYLCDHPVSAKKTCDTHLCEQCRHELDGKDYCVTHAPSPAPKFLYN